MDQEKLIQTMMTKGHSRSTAEGNIAGRGLEAAWKEYMGSSGGSGTSSLMAGQKAQEDDFLGRFRGAVAGQEPLTAMSERLGTELGLPALKQSAFDLTQTLKGIPRVQAQATRGFDVNANQLARKTAAEQAKIAPLAQEATAQAQFAQGELGDRLQLGVAEQNRQLDPFLKAELPLMSERLAREFTGYSQDRQNELTLLLSSQQRTAEQEARVFQLAQDEREFERQKSLLSFQTDESIRQKKATGGLGTVNEWEYM